MRQRGLHFLQIYGQLERSNGLIYKQIHVFADDESTLRLRDLSPDSCSVMDCWWLLGNRVAFVGLANCGQRHSAVYYRGRRHRIAQHNFLIWTSAKVVYREPFEGMLKRLEAWFHQQRKLPLGKHQLKYPTKTRTRALFGTDAGRSKEMSLGLVIDDAAEDIAGGVDVMDGAST